MRRAFTLVELLLVLGLVAAAWFWLPAMLHPAALADNPWQPRFLQLAARGAREAMARGRTVQLGVDMTADSATLLRKVSLWEGEVGKTPWREIASLTLPASAEFSAADSQRGSESGLGNNFVTSGSGLDAWAVWGWDAQGAPLSQGGLIAFKDGSQIVKFQQTSGGSWLLQ